MSSHDQPPGSPVERLKDVPAILRALHQAAGQAMRKHREAGVPVATCRDGAVVWIAPEDIPSGDRAAGDDDSQDVR